MRAGCGADAQGGHSQGRTLTDTRGHSVLAERERGGLFEDWPRTAHISAWRVRTEVGGMSSSLECSAHDPAKTLGTLLSEEKQWYHCRLEWHVLCPKIVLLECLENRLAVGEAFGDGFVSR